MNKTNDFKYNLPAYSDPVDIEDLNDNFRGIDDALMAGLCKKDYTGNNMGSSDPSARKYAWAPWLEIVNDNEFDVVVTDRNAPAGSEEATINIAAGQTFRKYINGRYYMNFYVQDQYDVTFKWFTNAETYINESGGGGGGTGTVTSVSVQGGSGSHLTGSGNPIETSGTITINVDEGYSIPQTNKQTAWDGKAADLKLEINSSTYVITAQLKDSSGNLIGNERTIDLPLESVVVSGTYDDQTKKVILTLQNGSTIEFSVADLVSGLQTELSASNKLDPDYIDYDADHRAVSDTEKNTWSGKQNALTFDDTPTQNSNNPVKSGGIYTALAGKQASLDNTQLAAVNSGIDSTKVAQISTNQSNILYVADQIGKNQLDISLDTLKAVNTSGTWNGNVYTLSVGTVTVNADGSITVKKTSTASRIVFYLSDRNADMAISGTKFASYILSGCPPTGSNDTYGLNGEQTTSPWGSVAIEYGNGYTINTSSIPVYFYISLNAAYTTPSEGLTFKPMICTAEAWSISHEFEPYALPNYDLTRLEAEDRAALAEEIDAGAKQLAQGQNNSGSAGTATIQSDGYTVKLTGSAASSSSLSFAATGTIQKTGTYVFAIEASGTMDRISIWDNTASASVETLYATGSKEVTLTAGHSYALFHFAGSAMTLNATVKYMICTKAAFGVSKAFVPYRPSYDDALFVLGERAPIATDDTKSGGSMNDFDSGCVLCTSNVTGGAKAGYCFVRTRIYDSNCALQQAFYPADNIAYQRCKWAGTWSEWKQFVS